jgi:hypothetical protein
MKKSLPSVWDAGLDDVDVKSNMTKYIIHHTVHFAPMVLVWCDDVPLGLYSYEGVMSWLYRQVRRLDSGSISLSPWSCMLSTLSCAERLHQVWPHTQQLRILIDDS